MAKSLGLEHTLGLMEILIKVIGFVIYNMDMASLKIKITTVFLLVNLDMENL